MEMATANDPSRPLVGAEEDRIGLRRPQFFIVGAPRCGTTALYTYLRQHPRIFMPECKEPHFFCDDLDLPDRVRASDAYSDLFAPAPNDSLLGEASVYYFSRRRPPRGSGSSTRMRGSSSCSATRST
jgi:hypothetical protein